MRCLRKLFHKWSPWELVKAVDIYRDYGDHKTIMQQDRTFRAICSDCKLEKYKTVENPAMYVLDEKNV